MEPHFRYTEKSVIIHRDESGFGFRVGGQNPVFVDCVHKNGAAFKAGVREKDHIIKVNGTLVRSYDHQSVVQMIQNCSPFVNLTLHSPEPVKPYGTVSGPLSINNNISASLSNIDTLTNNPDNLSSTLNNSIGTSNTNVINNLVMTANKKSPHSSLHQRVQSNNLNWLSKIEDDLFQDNQHNNDNNIANAHQPTGVSKLVETGPNVLNTRNSQSSFTGGVRPKIRQNRNQSSTRDNPYYYYKSVPEKPGLETSMCESSDLSCSNQDPNNHHNLDNAPSSTSSTGKSLSSMKIVRSRSSSKMTARSSSSKHKSRKFGSRIVDDLRLLTFEKIQANPSSLSASPSSSDLSDCDDTDATQPSLLTSGSSIGNTVANNTMLLPNPNSPTSNNPQNVTLKPRPTTRRLEIIRELVDTEKTHTERLKHLNDLLYKPIKAEGLVPPEQLKMIFSCHKTLFKIHRQIYKILLSAQKNVSERHQEPLIGEALVEIFEGDLGRQLEKAASAFCACQSINTELLNRFTRKDTKAGEFLAQVANQQMLGRLGIKDLLASCFQRLTKYPLLLDNLLKATPATSAYGIHSKSLSDGSLALTTNSNQSLINDTDSNLSNQISLIVDEKQVESNCTSDNNDSTPKTISNNESVDSSTVDDSNKTNNTDKNIDNSGANESTLEASTYLDDISIQQPIAEDLPMITTLDEEYAYERIYISRALVTSRQILTHVNEAVKREMSHSRLRELWKKTDKPSNLPDININNQHIIHEGPLTLCSNRRSFEVYVMLLTQYLIIFTREGQEKLKLKYFTLEGTIANQQLSPILDIDEHLAIRDSASKQNGFWLVCKNKNDSRMYEFASQSLSERTVWKEKIHMVQQYNYPIKPDDDNTLTRYSVLIPLATSSNTPNNIEQHCQPTA